MLQQFKSLEGIEKFLDFENDSRTKKPTLMRLVKVMEVDKGYADELVEPLESNESDETRDSPSIKNIRDFRG